MRMIVFFDLPTVTKEEKHNAARFRSFLQKDGYYMMQWSVYSRLCNGLDNVELREPLRPTAKALEVGASKEGR
jgi:CRISPR-associated protein Cas2